MDILEQYWQNGGTYVVPVEIINQINGELEEKDKEIERLLNIMRPEKADYNYIELLFETKSKENVIEAFTYKCEQLQNLYKSYEDKEIEARKKDNIITELEKDIDLELCKTRANDEYNKGLFNAFRYVKDKLQELKGSDK